MFISFNWRLTKQTKWNKWKGLGWRPHSQGIFYFLFSKFNWRFFCLLQCPFGNFFNWFFKSFISSEWRMAFWRKQIKQRPKSTWCAHFLQMKTKNHLFCSIEFTKPDRAYINPQEARSPLHVLMRDGAPTTRGQRHVRGHPRLPPGWPQVTETFGTYIYTSLWPVLRTG